MSVTIQLIIVIIIGIAAFGYSIYKIINMVKKRNRSMSPCCNCDISCKAREIKMKNPNKNAKSEKINREILHNQKI